MKIEGCGRCGLFLDAAARPPAQKGVVLCARGSSLFVGHAQAELDSSLPS